MTKWVTLTSGSHSKILTIQALLEAHGIPTYIPDAQTKVMDPFITGANPLQLELRVPAEAAFDAKRLLEEGKEQRPE